MRESKQALACISIIFALFACFFARNQYAASAIRRKGWALLPGNFRNFHSGSGTLLLCFGAEELYYFLARPKRA
jgi:hypothetical protein